jgi:cytochrome c2
LCLALAAVLGFGFLGQGVPQAKALNTFRVEFVAKYVKADSEDAKDKAFAAAVEKARCAVCHEGKDKKNRNVYGKALAELLDRKNDADNKEKIQAALKKTEAKRSVPRDEKSPTFGDLIKAGKLPAPPKS